MPNLAVGSYFIWRKPVNMLVGYIQLLILTYNVPVPELVYLGVALHRINRKVLLTNNGML